MSGNISDVKGMKDHVDAVVKESMDKLKQELFSFVEKECQLIRDRIEGPLPSYSTYTFDFFVENFKSLIKSGEDRYSPLWHINEYKTCVQGSVRFLSNGKLTVRLNNGRRPREIGLQPRNLDFSKVTATIIDARGYLSGIKIGEMNARFNETNIKTNADWGRDIGEIDCQKIIDEGYADKPDYSRDAVLVRYIVTVEPVE